VLPAPKFFILVVDNHSTAATTMSWVLEESGYAVSVVSDGKAALDIVSGIAFDLAVVEIILPDIDGIKIAQELCKRLPNCRILLMSANDEATTLLEKAKADGIHCDVLPKPIRPPELIAKLESLLAQQ
jgi:two-component system alkaline phosphatase synthesis response regulator PhoP